MSLDILESLSSALGGPVVRQISTALGESEDSTRAAVRSIGPAILAGLIHQVTSPAGAANLFRAVNDDRIDSGIVGRLPDILGKRGEVDALSELGESLSGAVFGTHSGAVTNAISQVSGVKPGSALSLVSMIIPIVFGMLRKHVAQNGLDTSGLVSLLLGQRRSLEKAGLDSRITSALGFGSLSSLLGASSSASAAQPTYTRQRPPEPSQQRSWLPWAIASGMAALGLLLLFNRTSEDSVTQPTAATPAATERGEERTRLASAATTVYFRTGETRIDSEDRLKIASVAQSVRQKDRPVTVTGYTDRTGTGDRNLELAKDRAVAVRDALVAEGVAESKIVMDPPAVVTGAGTEEEARRVDIELR